MKQLLIEGAQINLIPGPDWDWFGWDGILTISAHNNTLLVNDNYIILDIHVPFFTSDFSPRQYKAKAFCDIAGQIDTVSFAVDTDTLSNLIRINGASALLSSTTGTFTAITKMPSQKIVPNGTVPDSNTVKKGSWEVVTPNQQKFHENKSVTGTSVNTSQQVSADTYNKIAEKLGVEPAVIRAITAVEAAGSGFDKDGQVKVRFEGHKFKQCLQNKGVDTKKLIKEGHGDVIYDYSARAEHHHNAAAYDKAIAIDEQCAKSSSSFGAFQIMGFNYKEAGFNSLDEFVNAQSTADGQAETFAAFVANSPAKVKALQEKDFANFAKLYNGPDYADHNYDGKMRDAYNKNSPPPTSPKRHEI